VFEPNGLSLVFNKLLKDKGPLRSLSKGTLRGLRPFGILLRPRDRSKGLKAKVPWIYSKAF
jgi:hypothetical protein